MYGKEKKHCTGESTRIDIIQSALEQLKKLKPVVEYIESSDNKYK